MATDQTTAPPASSFLSPSSVSHRRRSLPSRATSAPGHGPANRDNVQPASPEVISSLISSLSTISTPAQSHFDNLPNIGSRTAPSSPGYGQTEFSHDLSDLDQRLQHGFGMDYGAYNKTADGGAESSFLHPDDAAIAPVVRMAKAPTSPRSRTSFAGENGGDSSPLRCSSRASHTSSKLEQDEPTGIGVISTEPGPRQSTASIASSNSGGKKSLKGQLNIFKRGSREFSKDKDTLPRTNSGGLGSTLNVSKSRTSLRSTHSIHSMGELAEEEGLRPETADLMEEEEEPRASTSSIPSPLKPSADAVPVSPGGIGSGRVIPTRESSLRHSYSGSSKKRRSARHSRYSSIGDFKIDRDIVEVNTDEEKVNKRIKELKEQQKKIKDELSEETTSKQDNRLSTATKSSSANRASHRSSYVVEEAPETNGVPCEEADESAPSPTVMTRRNKIKKRSTGPLASKTTNIQPVTGVENADKLSHTEQARLKRRSSTANSTGAESNRRASAQGPPPRLSSADDRPGSADSLDEAVEAYTASPRLTQKVSHPHTGRVIAFSEVGDPQGHVVFCCVGMGLTRYLTAFYDELAWTLKLRLITPDRPGVGESEPCMDGSGTPLSWPDDVAIICNTLRINKFSMLAHSAGAIYALATALRMPQHMRGRLHLLAPWIPPSQMSSMTPHKEPLPSNAVPYSQRLLRALPTPIFKVANSSFMNATSASITSSLPKSQRRSKRKNAGRETPVPPLAEPGVTNGIRDSTLAQPSIRRESQDIVSRATSNPTDAKSESAVIAAVTSAMLNEQRQSDYDNRLTHMIWDLATTNANPAVDLLICLERRQAIGFRYVDINRAVVIHHGSRDTRVPVENVKWLGKTMRRCEVRILEGEGHGLMASAIVMSNVLTEIAKEWEDWTTVVQGKREGGRRATITQY